MSKLQGRFIDKLKAEAEINKYLQIKKETKGIIANALSKSSKAAQKYFADDELSFVFERSTVEALLKLATERGCNALRVYYAAADKDEPELEIIEGSTTVVLVPAKVTLDARGNITNVENTLYSEAIAACQYPEGTDSFFKENIDISGDESNKADDKDDDDDNEAKGY